MKYYILYSLDYKNKLAVYIETPVDFIYSKLEILDSELNIVGVTKCRHGYLKAKVDLIRCFGNSENIISFHVVKNGETFNLLKKRGEK